MSNERKHDDMVYQMAISVAKNMLKNGIVNLEEYNRIDTILLKKYRPYLGSLFSDNACRLSEN